MPFDYPLYRSCLRTRQLGQELQHFASLDSTNAYAKRLARQNLAPDSSLVVVADAQTAGYGQHGRSWTSETGQGLYFTVLMSAEATPLQTLMVGVAVIDALRVLSGSDELGLKWVNDLVLRGRKLGGILVEACHQRWMAIGVGINLREVPEHLGIGLDRLDPPDTGTPSAKPVLHWPVERLLAEVLNHLERWADRLAAGEHDAVRNYWEACSVTLGQDIRITIGDREVFGHALGIDAVGALRVRTDEGRIELFTSGTVRRADGAYC
jgi:BirA family biotin operon repressor/biotin-[acetyl-CoA-carboxylase] ligase